MPPFMGEIGCGSIHIDLDADTVRDGQQQQQQVVDILEGQLGPCISKES